MHMTSRRATSPRRGPQMPTSVAVTVMLARAAARHNRGSYRVGQLQSLQVAQILCMSRGR